VTRDELRRTIVSCLDEIAPDADAAHLDPGADLRDALDLDSMDFLRFLQAVSRTLGIDVPERDYRALRTLADCEDYCAAHAGA
jgi:acyl carrier protein